MSTLSQTHTSENLPETHLKSNELIGAVFLYVLNLGRKRFKNIYHNDHERRNMVMGFIIKLLLLVGVTYLIVAPSI
jgi:hypothetical protein